MLDFQKQVPLDITLDTTIDRRRALKALVGIVLGSSAGCDQDPNPERGIDEILEVQPHHATRIMIVYRDRNGETYTRSTHHSNTFTDKNVSLHPSDFLTGRYPYGKFDAEKYIQFQKLQNTPRGTE